MLRVCVRHWCLLLLAVLMSVSSIRLPFHVISAHPISTMTSAKDTATGERQGVVKRSNRQFGSFYRLMQKHSRYMDEQAFVEKMFRLFDMNSDDLIERDEFRAIMQLLGLVSHSY